MSPSSASMKKKRQWAPRIWQGSSFPAWIRLLMRNRFAVEPAYWYIAAIVTVVSAVHTVVRFFEEAFFQHRIRRTRINHPPLFVLGHWRTGTTLLHELLILDSRHNFPNTYQCLEPNHFLLTEQIITRTLGVLLPGSRPMDNMSAGWDKPQEEEFALCMLGVPSPYLSIAFPKRPPMDDEYLDMIGVPRRAQAKWKQALMSYFQKLTFKDGRRLVVKSPPHTSRIPILLEMFPEAQFVSIVRNPYVVYASTVNLWKAFHQKHGLQRPESTWVEEYVFRNFERMMERYESTKGMIPAGRLHELKYEDLVRDPIGEMRKLYSILNLGNWDAVESRIQEYFEQRKDYETNKYAITPELKAEIARRWGATIARWGYEPPN